MNDFSRLSAAWVEWTSMARMPGVSVSTDCQISFLAKDQSFHLRQENGWWTIDEVDDRGKRYDGTAKFSTFELVEKYLIWRWGSFTRGALVLEAVGPKFYKQGYSSDVSVVPTENQWRVELKSSGGSAILGQPDSTIFSHLMTKSLGEIDHMVRDGLK